MRQRQREREKEARIGNNNNRRRVEQRHKSWQTFPLGNTGIDRRTVKKTTPDTRADAIGNDRAERIPQQGGGRDVFRPRNHRRAGKNFRLHLLHVRGSSFLRGGSLKRWTESEGREGGGVGSLDSSSR